MKRRLAKALARLYPRNWRERYGAEFEALLEEGTGSLGAALDVMLSALGERVSPTTGEEMTAATSRMETWTQRAPWAVFGIAPVGLLAAAYFAALAILWSGWQMFLPNEQAPFVPVQGWAVAWFGVGRVLYFGAPVLAGIWLAVAASRSRIGFLWPTLGAAFIATIDSVVQVQTVRPSLNETGRVHLELAAWHPGYSAVVLGCTLATYWWLRARRGRSLAA